MYLSGTEIGKHIDLIERFRDASKARLRAMATEYAASFETMSAADQSAHIADMLLQMEARADLKSIVVAAQVTREAVAKVDAHAVAEKHKAAPVRVKRTKHHRRRLTPQDLAEIGMPEMPTCVCGKTTLTDPLAAEAVVAARVGIGVRRSYRCPLCGNWHVTKQEPRGAARG